LPRGREHAHTYSLTFYSGGRCTLLSIGLIEGVKGVHGHDDTW